MRKSQPEFLLTRKLSKHFGGLRAVNTVDLDIREGETLGFIGPNGAGKTTLFNLITGFLKPTAGTVLFRSRPLTGLRPSTIANLGISRTFQLVRNCPDMTVLENVMIGCLSDRLLGHGGEIRRAEDKARGVVKRVGLEDKADRPARILSYGDAKKLELGRALAPDPKVFLLDEPFAGLGGRELSDMISVIRELQAEGRTLVIIEHKLRVLMPLVARVVVLNFGEKLAEGTPAEIATNIEVQRAYLGSAEPVDA